MVFRKLIFSISVIGGLVYTSSMIATVAMPGL